MVHSSVDERDINKDYPADIAVLGDAKLVLRQMIGDVKRQLGPGGRQGTSEVVQEVETVKEAWMKKWMPKLTSDEVPINPYRLIWDLRNTLDRNNTIITHDSGHPRDQIAPFWETLIPHGFIGWGKSTQLGTSLGLAIGAKLAAPEKTVAHLLGDAAFGMCGIDFETAVRNQTPILTVLMNNSLLGGYDRHLHAATERYGTRYISGNYTKVAEGLGGYTERVEQPKDIIPAIKRCLQEMAVGRPALLEVITREEEDLCNPGR
jgi:thiamine pyrophosphate-dependent acetolactate synthase large subunit-like protein